MKACAKKKKKRSSCLIPQISWRGNSIIGNNSSSEKRIISVILITDTLMLMLGRARKRM
jgi:hypothetical protein